MANFRSGLEGVTNAKGFGELFMLQRCGGTAESCSLGAESSSVSETLSSKGWARLFGLFWDEGGGLQRTACHQGFVVVGVWVAVSGVNWPFLHEGRWAKRRV